MNESDKQLIRNAWGELSERRERVGELFYARLFEMDPALRELFRGDLQVQGERLTRMLDRAVASLDDMAELTPLFADLGRRHAALGVTETNFQSFGEALMWSLQRSLWSDFTPDTETAWCEFYRLLASTMLEAARVARNPQDIADANP